MLLTRTRQKECLSKFKQIVYKCKKVLFKSKEEKLQLQQDKAWAKIEDVIATQNYLDYPWIYTAYILTENDIPMLNDWCFIITIHCQLIRRNFSIGELDIITHCWLGSRGIDRFI